MQSTTALAAPLSSFTPPPLNVPTSGLSGAYVRNSPASDICWSPHTGAPKPKSDSPDACPVYSSVLRASDLPDSLKEGSIYDQESLEKAWSSIQDRWQTETPTEEDFVLLLKSGIRQTDTCKALLPLIEKALLRLINSLENVPERPGELVKIICNLPSIQWANALSEDVKLPHGPLYGFIQQEVMHSHALQRQMIEAGELIDDAPWKAVRELTDSVRAYVPTDIEGPVNDYLRQLEDCSRIRPSPKEAQILVAGLVEALKETPLDLNLFWPESLVVAAQKLSSRLAAIEIVDSRPDRSWLEEIVDPQALQESLAKVATPMNAALTQLGSMSLKDAAEGLMNGVNTVLMKVGHYFVSDAESKPASEQQVDSTPAVPELLSAMQEIEKKSSFLEDVVTTGPRYTGGISGKMLYALNVLDTFGVLGIAEKVRPHLPAVPTLVPVVIPPKAPEAPPLSGAQLLDRAEKAEKEIHDFLASLPPTSVTGENPEVGTSALPPPTRQSTSSTIGGLDIEQVVQAIGDVLSKIDDALTFPSASADELEGLLQELEKTSNAAEGLNQFEPVGPLLVTPTTRWELIKQQFTSILLRVSTALAPYSPDVLQLIRDNPGASVTAAFVTLSALYNEYRQSLQDPTAPGTALPPQPESPALHQERMEDDIEQILVQPVAAGKPGLTQTILKLMYQSTEHDLLDDEQLIEDVAQALQQPSPQNPAKTYLELIHEAQAAGHAGHAESVSNTHHVRKRDTAAVEASVVPLTLSQDVAPMPEVEDSESEKQATLSQYLNTMVELQSPAADADEEIDNEPSESVTDTAKQVISLLRHRRAATWTDASRANGDAQLVERYANALTNYADGKVSYSATTVAIPMHSTFGQCWLNLVIAFQNPFFIDWARQANLDLATVRIQTADGTLTGKVKGVVKTFTLKDDSGWANVAGPILRTAGIVDPTYIGVAYSAGSSVPLALVNRFHGERSTPSRTEARQRAQELATEQAFAHIEPDDPLRPQESRSEAQVEKQRQRLGDLYTHHALITTLSGLIRDKAEGTSVDLDAGTLGPHKDSLFAIKHPQEARRMVTAHRFISAMGWKVPKTVGEVLNLIKVLSFALPESNERADYKGALGFEGSLNPLIYKPSGKLFSASKNR